MQTNDKLISEIRRLFATTEPIPLHAPVFFGKEKEYLAQCIDTTFVSYVGEFVTKFDNAVSQYTGAKYAVCTASGTVALHLALVASGVRADDEVITQALTFVATVNPIIYCNAHPVFVDSDKKTLGMSYESLQEFIETQTEMRDDGFSYNKKTSRRVSTCIPVHIFGHPCEIGKIKELCEKKNITLIEDAAESIGSFYKGKHTGTFGKVGILSFNGNKTITTGGGGMLITDDQEIANKAKSLSTTAKRPHKWEFFHESVAFNYRMPNVNAAIGCAQMESLPTILEKKRELADEYREVAAKLDLPFVDEPTNCRSNFWLNSVVFSGRAERDSFLEASNSSRVMTRPIWALMSKLPMFANCQKTSLATAEWFEERVVNIPSSVRISR